MMARPVIKWRGDVRRFDKYELHENFLWGAKLALYPGTVSPPGHPTLQEEFWAGYDIAVGGYISMRRDVDPKEIVRRLKQEHRLKREELAAALLQKGKAA